MQPAARPSLWAWLKCAFFARIGRDSLPPGLFGRQAGAITKPARKERTLTFATLSEGGRFIGASELGDAHRAA